MKMNVICERQNSRTRVSCEGWVAHLHAILDFCYQWTIGYEGEELALHGEGHRDDEAHKQHHLEHQQGEDLSMAY